MVFTFLQFELDEDRFELRRDAVPVRVEPRVLDLVLYLVRHRDRVVPKDELIANVWRQHVSESALTRAVASARRILETPGADETIRTIHGRGYRFVVPVVVSALPESNAAPPDIIAAASSAERSDPVADPQPPPHRQRPTPSRFRMARIGAGIVLLFIAVAGALWMRARAAAPVRALPARVALLPVSVGQDDRDSQLLAFSVSDSLAHTLSRVPEIALQPPEYGREVSLESPSLAEFGKRSGVQFVLSGGLRRSVGGQKAQLVMTLHEVLPSGGVRETPLGRYDVPYLSSSTDVRSFVAVRDAIERNLLEELLPAVRLPRPGTAPAHPDAYRLYLLGKSRLGEATCEGEAALSLLAESLALDPGFAPAWEAYGWAEYGLASSCASDAAHYAKALDAADRALELEPKWPRAVGLKTAVLAETGRAEDAWDLLREELGRAPASSDLKAQAVYVLGYAGALEEAERRLGELIQADPNYLTEYGWTPNPYLYRGDIDRFLRHLPATDTPLFRYYRGLAEISRGRKDAAREAVEPAFRLNPGDVFARLSQALLAIIENDPAGARAVLDELAAHRRLVGSSDGEMTYKIGQLYVMAGDHEAGLAQLATAVRQGFFCAACLANDPLLRPVSGSLRYREIVRAATTRHQQFRKRFAL